MEKKIKIRFAPGCFDDFDGSQEELEQLMTYIQEYFEQMSLEEILNSDELIDIEEFDEEFDEEFEEDTENINRRTLH